MYGNFKGLKSQEPIFAKAEKNVVLLEYECNPLNILGYTIHVCMHTCMYVYVFVCTGTYVNVYICVYVCICVHVCVCVCVYKCVYTCVSLALQSKLVYYEL